MRTVVGHPGVTPATPGGDFMRRVTALLERLNAGAAAVAAALLWMLALLVFMDIVLRVAGAPILWSNEVSVYLLIAVVYLGIGYTYDRDGHFAILLVVDRLPRKARLFLELFTVLLSLGFAILLTCGGIALVQFARSLSMASPTLLHVPLAVPYTLVIAGGVSLSISLVLRLLNLAGALHRGADVAQREEHSI